MSETSPNRLQIMISSTSFDLPDHRQQVMDAILRLGFFPLAMEYSTAASGSDAIQKSLEWVDEAEVYIGIFAERYGYKPADAERNPQNLSVTELEYRRAVERGIPTLIFLSHADHSFTSKQFETDPDSRAKLEALKAELSKKQICGFFRDSADLRALVVQSLAELRPRSPKPIKESANKICRVLPEPPEFYAVPTYNLTSQFIGRASELELLDKWAMSSSSLMVVEGIGGLGKSALTWEWFLQRAPQSIPGLKGRVWWSFYEQGTSMVTFVRHALAYVTGRDPEALRDTQGYRHYDRAQQLLTELRRQPWLLVLDGFERVLTAYARLDRAQQRDDRLEEDLRECVNPQDGDLLTQLRQCGPSKILVSTRLFPRGLEDKASHKPLKGVEHHHLNGLSESDTLAFLEHAGVRGNEQAMLEFAKQFGRHSLLLKIVCGLITDYRKQPGDFDAWRADPVYGASLKLTELDIKQRQTHILHFALQGLDELTKKLLARIAVISENADYAVLSVLNPFLPEGDSNPDNPEYRAAIVRFDRALQELEDRGLLMWDRESGRYDMHPVVRGQAAELLQADDRAGTFDTVRNHFESLPPDNLETATEIAHVTHSLEIYRCLVGAGLLDDAFQFYRGDLANTLRFHVGANALMVELLRPLFRNNLQGLPLLSSPSDQSYVLNDLSIALSGLGRESEAVDALAKALPLDLARSDWTNLSTGLRNLSISLSELDRQAESVAVLELARELAEAADDVDGVTTAVLHQMDNAIAQGRFPDAEQLEAQFRQRPLPPKWLYRLGTVERARCQREFYQNRLTLTEWQAGYEVAVRARNVVDQYAFLALRAEWELGKDDAKSALEHVDQALQITTRLGTPVPSDHDLRAWSLALLNRPAEAQEELATGYRRLAAAEAYLILGDREQALECALNAYRQAWGEGPPYIDWYGLKRSRELLARLGEPEPQLPPFDPAKVPPIPYEKEIREVIAKLKAEKARLDESSAKTADAKTVKRKTVKRKTVKRKTVKPKKANAEKASRKKRPQQGDES